MTTRTDYSADEWRTLSKLPQAVAVAVIASGESGPFQLMRELAALTSALTETRQQPPANELVTAVAAAEAEVPLEGAPPAVSAPEVAPPAVTEPAPARGESNPAVTGDDLSSAAGQRTLRQEALDQCTMAMAILATRSPAEEADGYKRWVMAIARKVAQSAKEGSFFGIGGTSISAEEQETLTAIAAALEVTP